MVGTYAIVALIAYLLGSIPFGYILVRVFRGEDVRAIGSGNIGATNVARSGAKGLAIATLLLDASKGALAVAAARLLWSHLQGEGYVLDCFLCTRMGEAVMLAALFAVLGHMFPVWLRFKGGKGVATALGALLLIDPIPLVGCLALFGVIVAVTRYVSLGSIIAAATYPAFLLLFGASHIWPMGIWPLALISLLVIVKHHANIRRLLGGTENRLGGNSTSPPHGMEGRA